MSGSSKYKFKKYNLSKDDIQILAYVAKREQGTVKGAKAELSLMANLFESRGSNFSSIVDYVLHSGWFASASTGGKTNEASYVNAVREVLIKGNRTLPPGVNEHDCIVPADISYAENNGKSFPPTDRSKYIQGVTFLKNIYGSSYYFWCFPDEGADPFGYTNKTEHDRWIKRFGVKGELYYQDFTGKKIDNDVNASSVDDTSGSSTLLASPEKLYSSSNYSYVKQEEKTTKSASQQISEKAIAEVEKKISEGKLFSVADDVAIASIAQKSFENKGVEVVSKTLVQGTTNTSTLPVVSTEVEAPYFEVKLGDVWFGGYRNNRIPNYVKSLNVVKTNGSINEYTINLIHQVRPGDNPNYIDSILSKQGYNTINIRYGNANTGQIFSDNEALISDIDESFDFSSCNIHYTIHATSIAAVTGSSKRNFPGFSGKVSEKIRELLWKDPSEDLLKAFPGMRDQVRVESLGLIPSNDSIVTVGEVKGITAVGYLSMLVNKMQNITQRDKEISSSTYMFSVSDFSSGSTFKISEVYSSISSVPFMYEVNVGYPDNNFVLGFDVNTNFSWSITYNSSKKIQKYDYEIDGLGNLHKNKVPAAYKNPDDVLGSRMLWTSLTRYPIEAKLQIRGLLQDSLVMQYIKVNVVMYGSKRITSGVYIVTGQLDSIGNGVYTTTLDLMRVAGDEEYINLDGRRRV